MSPNKCAQQPTETVIAAVGRLPLAVPSWPTHAVLTVLHRQAPLQQSVRGLRIEMVDEYDVQFEFPKVRGAKESILSVRRVGTDAGPGRSPSRSSGPSG